MFYVSRFVNFLLFFSLLPMYMLGQSTYNFNDIYKGFNTIPDSIQTSVYWYWISDNISKEGVVKDLISMKKVGINRAFIGNIGLDSSEVPYGKVKLFSPEWQEIIHTAMKTASQLGIEIGIFNGPGWSQSGGPWIKPTQSMRYLNIVDTVVSGKKSVHIHLPRSSSSFQFVKALAIPYKKSHIPFPLDIRSQSYIKDVNKMFDSDTNTSVFFNGQKDEVIDVTYKTEVSPKSIMIYPINKTMFLSVKMQVFEDDKYNTVKVFDVDRANDNLNVGFKPYAPVTISINAKPSKKFRFIFSNISSQAGITDISLSENEKVERYEEKSFAKMFQSPHPLWDAYKWPSQDDSDSMISSQDVIDVSSHISSDGLLDWKVPEGEWIIMCAGMTPTGVTNGPAVKQGRGLEVDKMSKEHIKGHFDAYVGELLKSIPAKDRTTWKYVVEDSYETGGQNWTDGFIDEFTKQYHYDPVSFIPVLNGYVIGSKDQSDRFLWDLRRFVADKIAYNYVGGLRDISHKNGLKTWLENYGHWGFPSEFLLYGSQSDEIGGEFWNEGELGNIECRAASSSAHIYGKNKVSAESFTAGGNTYGRYPVMLKQRGDRFFTEGINNTLLHVYISQPDDRMPGINAGFGTEFNRHNTWFYELPSFIKYLKRCNFLLQTGQYVADVAYFIGEDAPVMTGIIQPSLPQGYSFDYINADVIENRLTIKNGRFVLPNGISYAAIILPPLKTMRPTLLKKLQQLVQEGGVILGERPIKSPSLENYPVADDIVKRIGDTLWGDIGKKGVTEHDYGKGKVFDAIDLNELFKQLHIVPDMQLPVSDPVLFIHRKMDDIDIYFLSNQTNKREIVNPVFRVEKGTPYLWDPVSGEQRELKNYTRNKNSTLIPLTLNPGESVFILFDKKKGKPPIPNVNNYGDTIFIKEIKNPWEVNFDTSFGGIRKSVIFDSLIDWTNSRDSLIKFFSGSAVYNNTFSIDKINGDKIYLDLGTLSAVASIKINGKYVGSVWTYPYRLDIKKYLKVGSNNVSVKVTNTWVNRMIGDSRLPLGKRRTWANYNPYTPESKLEKSGLFGPITIEEVNY